MAIITESQLVLKFTTTIEFETNDGERHAAYCSTFSNGAIIDAVKKRCAEKYNINFENIVEIWACRRLKKGEAREKYVMEKM